MRSVESRAKWVHLLSPLSLYSSSIVLSHNCLAPRHTAHFLAYMGKLWLRLRERRSRSDGAVARFKSSSRLFLSCALAYLLTIGRCIGASLATKRLATLEGTLFFSIAICKSSATALNWALPIFMPSCASYISLPV